MVWAISTLLVMAAAGGVAAAWTGVLTRAPGRQVARMEPVSPRERLSNEQPAAT